MESSELMIRITALIETATIHFTSMSTFVIVYIVGLYAFLRAAPLSLRLIAYIFFVASFLVYITLGSYILDMYFYLDDSGVLSSEESPLPSRWYDGLRSVVAIIWYGLVTITVVALGWLTFFFTWKQTDEE